MPIAVLCGRLVCETPQPDVHRARPSASVVTNNHNYERFPVESIDSALGQSHRDTEVVVVDDGSSDRSPEIIRSYGSRIRHVLKPNGGQGSALNAGFAAARGDVIIFLDADDALHPHAVATVLE